jgi:hypothetical protein
MNGWLLALFLILIFAPKGSAEKTGRWNFRAVLLLLCIIGLVSQV